MIMFLYILVIVLLRLSLTRAGMKKLFLFAFLLMCWPQKESLFLMKTPVPQKLSSESLSKYGMKKSVLVRPGNWYFRIPQRKIE